jgi:hypothetical protein
VSSSKICTRRSIWRDNQAAMLRKERRTCGPVHLFLLRHTLVSHISRNPNFTMASSDVPEAVLAAVEAGELTQLQHLYQTGMSVEEIAKHAARHKQPQILIWCYERGWAPPRTSYNNEFFLAAVTGASPTIFQILVDRGWDLNGHETESCGDALACAISSGEYDFAK